ncbi:MAG: hypothetical protein ACI4F8_11205 [Lachnospiraceae bacterium]
MKKNRTAETTEYWNPEMKPELSNLKVLYGLFAFLWFTSFLMPQYFGVRLGFDFTCTRIADVLIVLYMIMNPKILTHFWFSCVRCKLLIPLWIYLFVCGYTMVLRADINAFFLPFMEILTFMMLIYGVRYVIGFYRAINWTVICAYVLSLYGLVEYVCKQSLMLKFLRTMPTIAGNAYRSGQYRIMGPCQHALGYGLLLIIFVAVVSYDTKTKKINLFHRPLLILLLYANIMLTGSRSTLGIAVAEAVLIIVVSERENRKKEILILAGLIILLASFLLLFSWTNIAKTMMLSITSLVDQVFGTNYAVAYGAETTRLANSENYRKFLPKIFTLDWLNPFIGRGVKRSFSVAFDGYYIRSIDNYYVHQYIKYAYPGMISYVLFVIGMVIGMIKEWFRYRTALYKIIMIGTICYFYNLWWVDALQTLKYIYALLAIFFATYLAQRDSIRGTIREHE